MIKKIINFITNEFILRSILAIAEAILSCCYMLQNNYILSILWGFCSVCNIILVYYAKGDN